MYRGEVQDFYWKKVTCDVSCVHFHIKVIDETLFDQHIKSYTSSDDMNYKVVYWLDFFEIFHNQYIIMLSESLNSSFPEESLYITVR